LCLQKEQKARLAVGMCTVGLPVHVNTIEKITKSSRRDSE